MSGRERKPSIIKRIGQALGLIRQSVSVVIIGLDNSGKTSIISKLNAPKRKTQEDVVPTVGFKEESFDFDGPSGHSANLKFHVYDMSGQSRYRTLWEQHYESVDAIIFVIDGTDRLRMCQVQDELATLLEHDAVRDLPVPMLFFCNKMDLPNSLTPVEAVESLELEQIRDKPWHIEASNALTGEGLENGIIWLAEHILERTAEAKGK